MRFAMAALVIVMGSSAASAQNAAPLPAPAPGSPAIFKSAADLEAVLKKATASAAGMTTSNVANTDQYSINIVHRDKAAGAVAHAGNTELHYIIEGSGVFVSGGKLLRGAEGPPVSIEGGSKQRFVKGDVLVIPANSPHWYSVLDGPITYLEVRWLAPK